MLHTVQEAIDVAVILNALRAIGGGELRETEADEVEMNDFQPATLNHESGARGQSASVPLVAGR